MLLRLVVGGLVLGSSLAVKCRGRHGFLAGASRHGSLDVERVPRLLRSAPIAVALLVQLGLLLLPLVGAAGAAALLRATSLARLHLRLQMPIGLAVSGSLSRRLAL